ncbi:Crp/Fnr family transcriptional regulator [Ohtaekwangia kribbensis]|uniref:Crp/Fnr family transcriptional regulator n=1 Tax=Ohtaekwangia kribbensis TaxID=688913 RepID=A0ABW3JW25_9BACT
MFESLKQNIAKHISISDNEIEDFCRLFEIKLIRRKERLLEAGHVCTFEGFVDQGLFRVYHIDANGFEQILYFAAADWWITDIDSFTNEKPSNLYIEALEDSKVYIIKKEKKEYAYEHFPKIERLFRIMTQKTHVALQQRVINILGKTADERYLDFLQKYSHHQHLSNSMIAAYLGISREFVSKIRRKLSQKK